jgi:isopenicillin N synthase-like dioxygenase
MVDRAQKAAKMPLGFRAEVAELDTFKLPDRATGSLGDHLLGKALIDAWRKDGIIQIAMTDEEKMLWDDAKAASQKFFRQPHAVKAACVDSQSYAGYIASGEEVTDGIADYSEIFTITKDLDATDHRVRAGWPCHGPCPWPDSAMKETMTRYNEALGRQGEKLLGLIEMGLGLAPGSLTRYTRDGWHHTRVLRYVTDPIAVARRRGFVLSHMSPSLAVSPRAI